MSETIELTENDLELGDQGTFFGWFIMESLGTYLDESKSPWTFDKRLEISLTINGKEMPIRTVIGLIEQNLDKLVLKKAEELLQSKLHNMRDTLYYMERYVSDQCRKLGLKDREQLCPNI